MSTTISVRILLPGDYTPKDSVGHYDMIINGTHNFHNQTYTNPVFSYRSSGHVHVFNESDTSKIYPHTTVGDHYYDCSVHKWNFTVSDSAVPSFLSTMESWIESFYKLSTDIKNLGDLVPGCSGVLYASNPFHKYSKEKYNCFHAVAVWLEKLGNFTLSSIYDAAHNQAYLDYSPSAMAAKYSGSWKRYYPE